MDQMIKPETSKGRPRRMWPPNSIKYFRKLKGVTLTDLAARVGTSYQTMQKIEARKMQLTPEWAVRIGRVLEVRPEDLAYSADGPRESWGTRAVPIVGVLSSDFQITPISDGRSVGARFMGGDAIVAFESTSTSPWKGWVGFYDDNQHEPISRAILERQERSARFISRLHDGSLWFRQISQGARKGRYHLSEVNVAPILDAKIEWVVEVIAMQPWHQTTLLA